MFKPQFLGMHPGIIQPINCITIELVWLTPLRFQWYRVGIFWYKSLGQSDKSSGRSHCALSLNVYTYQYRGANKRLLTAAPTPTQTPAGCLKP